MWPRSTPQEERHRKKFPAQPEWELGSVLPQFLTYQHPGFSRLLLTIADFSSSTLEMETDLQVAPFFFLSSLSSWI